MQSVSRNSGWCGKASGHRHRVGFVGGAAALLLAAMGGHGQAASPTIGSLSVTLTIEDDCVLESGSTLDFGTHGVFASALTGEADLLVTCTAGTDYFIGLGAGANPSTPGDVDTRRMLAGASDYIGYQLYKEDTLTNVWGDSGAERVSATGDGTQQTQTVYGEVPVPATVPPAGTYSDTVTVTISF